VKERAEVIARLLDTLDEDASDDVAHHAAWTEAIDRRLADVRQGRVNVVDAPTAVARARGCDASALSRSIALYNTGELYLQPFIPGLDQRPHRDRVVASAPRGCRVYLRCRGVRAIVLPCPDSE